MVHGSVQAGTRSLLASKEDKIDQARALAELAQAAAQLKLLEKLRKTRG